MCVSHMANGFWRGKYIHKRGWWMICKLFASRLWWTIEAISDPAYLTTKKLLGPLFLLEGHPVLLYILLPSYLLTPPEWSQIIPNMWLHALLNHGLRVLNITGKGLVIWNLNRSISTGPLKKMSSVIETLWQDSLRLAGTTAYSHDWTLTKLCRFHHLAIIFLRLLHWPWNKQISLALSRYKKVRAPPRYNML